VNTRLALVVAVTCAVAVIGCGGGSPTSVPSGSAPGATQSAPGGTAGAGQPTPGQSGEAPSPTAPGGTPAAPGTSGTVETVVGPGDFDLLDLAVGLDQLSSYQADLVATFDGTDHGQARHWTVTWQRLHSSDPGADQFVREVTGDNPPAASSTVWQLGESILIPDGNGGCVAQTAGSVNPSDLFQPAAFLSGLIGAEDAGHESLNGFDAQHYSFDERALGLAALAQSTGDVWVASDGGFVVRLTETSQGGDVFFGEGTSGSLTWEYQLSSVNQPVAVTLPSGCETAPIDAPLPADAAVVIDVPGLLEYDTASSVSDVLDFYATRASGQGWTVVTQPTTTDGAGLVEFSDRGSTVSVFAQPGDAGTRVIITSAPPG
jgi:hypothetical protein